jgi:hypothetical protein
MNSLWLTFVLKQGGATPLILIQAPDEDYFHTVRRSVSNLGFRSVTAEQFAAGAWPDAPLVEVDVSREGLLARVHLRSKDKSIVPSGEEPMTVMWMVAAKQMRRVLVAVVPPGTLSDDVTEQVLPDQLGRVAGARQLYVGLASFFDDRFQRRVPRPPLAVRS